MIKQYKKDEHRERRHMRNKRENVVIKYGRNNDVKFRTT